MKQELVTISRLRQLEGHTAAVQSIVFFNDGRRVLTSSHDLKIRSWDVLAGELQDILQVESERAASFIEGIAARWPPHQGWNSTSPNLGFRSS